MWFNDAHWKKLAIVAVESGSLEKVTDIAAEISGNCNVFLTPGELVQWYDDNLPIVDVQVDDFDDMDTPVEAVHEIVKSKTKETKIKPISLIRPAGTRPVEIPPDYQVKEKFPTPVRMICDGDLHYPIHDPRVTAAKFKFAQDFKPDAWVNLGDLYDFWPISAHEKHPERWLEKGGRLQEEFDSATDYWDEVTRIAKHVHFIPGNHENRLQRLIMANPGLFKLRAFDWVRLADIPASVNVHDYGAFLEIGGITFEHGDRLGGRFGVVLAAQWALVNRGRNTIFGHTHRSELKYRTKSDGNIIFAANQGHGSDVSKQKYAGPVPNWQHGFTAIEFWTEGGQPRFTVHPITIVNGRFSFGGRVYDGSKA